MFNLNFKRFVRTIPILWLVGPEGGQMEKRPESVRASWQAGLHRSYFWSPFHIILPLSFHLSYHFAFVISILCHQDRKSEYQRKKSSCWTTKSHLICPSFYSHGKVARNVNCDIEFASSVTLGASCESVTVASCESETEAKCKLICCCLRSERSRRQNPALRNSGKQCQGHNSHTTLWIAQDQPHIPFWPIGYY